MSAGQRPTVYLSSSAITTLKGNASITVNVIRFSLALLLSCLLAISHVALADANKQQKDLKKDIKRLSSSLNKQKNTSAQLNQEVTRLETKLSDIDKKKHNTENRIDALRDKLLKANLKRQQLGIELKQQRGALTQQLQALYSAGEQSHLRLLLRHDNPAEISRNSRYLEYLNAHRTKRIDGINKMLSEIKTLTATIHEDTLALNKQQANLSQQSSQLKNTLQAREIVLNGVRKDIRGKEKRLKKMQSEKAQLQRTIDRLARQAAARVAKRDAVKQKQQAQRKQQKNTASKSQSKSKRVSTRFTPNKPFSTLKGKLSWPVKGRITGKYQSQRNERQRWDGVVIAASGGAKVRAIAKGRVAYSGYMNGYGHLIIIEHDRSYLSLYGYNRAVYKREGQIVNANEVIASVGNSGGQSQNALYFGIRKGTRPQNPATWCR